MPILEFAKDYWQLLAFAVGLIVAWTKLSDRIKVTELSIASLNTKQEKVDAAQTEIKVQLASIITSLKFIERQLQIRPHQ